MESNIYQQNLQVLGRKDPTLAAQVYSGVEDEEVEVRSTAEGYPTIGVRRNSELFLLHHPENPLADAKRIVEETGGVNDTWRFIHLGMGLGYAGMLLASRQPDPPAGQVLIERSLSVFRKACQMIDLTKLFDHPGTQLIVGKDPVAAYQCCMAELMEFMANPPKLVKNNPSLHLDGPYYEACVSKVEEALRFGQSGLLSKQADGLRYLQNLIANLERTVNAPGIRPMQSQLRGVPAVVVAAGPSLSKNIHELKGTEDRWLIVAVDTALEKCLDNGITPHLVCTVDPSELNRKHFPRESYPPEIHLLFDPEAEPNIVGQFDGHAVTYNSTKHPFHDWFDRETGPKGQVVKGAMVSQAAFLVCRFLGCSPIILVGQDLALDPDTGKTHDPDAKLVQTVEYIDGDESHVWHPSVHDRTRRFKENLFWVEGVNGKPVPTLQNLRAYLRLLERDISETHEEVLDATEGGAKIAGAEPRVLAEVAQECQAKRFDWEAFLAECRAGTPKKGKEHAREILETLRRRLRQARRVAKKGLEIVQPWMKEGPPDREPAELQADLDPLRHQIFDDPITDYMIDQTASATLFDFLKLGPACIRDRRTRCGEVVRRYHAAFQATVESSEHLGPVIENEIERLRF